MGLRVGTWVCVCMCVCLCVCVGACMHVQVCVCGCVFVGHPRVDGVGVSSPQVGVMKLQLLLLSTDKEHVENV